MRIDSSSNSLFANGSRVSQTDEFTATSSVHYFVTLPKSEITLLLKVKVKVKERIVLSEIHLRTTGRHLSMGAHSVICHPTQVTAQPSPQPGRLVLDLSTL